MASPSNGRTKIFISYSHKDTNWLRRLRVHLRPLERDYPLDVWDDTMIQTGAQWRRNIKNTLKDAQFAVLLISADFFASDFIFNDELPPLLAAAKKRGVLIFSLIISSGIRFSRHKELSSFQSVNPPSKPLLRLTRARQEEFLEKVSLDIESAIAEAALQAASSGVNYIDKVGDQLVPFLSGSPAVPKKHRFIIEGGDSKIVTKWGGQIVKTVTADDLKKLPNSQLKHIQVYENAMKKHYKKWKDLYSQRQLSHNRRVNAKINRQLKQIVAAMKDDLNGILSFLELSGMQLDDHYLHIRQLVSQVS